MSKAGVGLKVAAVANAMVLVGGFLGCQSGAFTWLAEKNEPRQSVSTPAASAQSQQSPPTDAKPEPVFISGTKSPFPPSLGGLVTGLTPAGTVQPSQPEPRKNGAEPSVNVSSP